MGSMGSQRVGQDLVTKEQQSWKGLDSSRIGWEGPNQRCLKELMTLPLVACRGG